MPPTPPTPLSYGEYLRLPDLLGQLRPLSVPVEHDEVLFITAHQACELWFRQLIAELTDARDRMLAGDGHLPRLRLRRCHVIARLLASQFDVLDTMAPPDFLRFRGVLGRASGSQSAQFHEIELLSGARPRPGREPTLWDGFLAVLAKAGFAVASERERRAALLELAGDREDHAGLWELAEALVEHDQAWAAFRFRHMLTVERQIGRRPGTGGTSGAAHLADRLRDRFYPELWELRASLS
ncbi:tryptophan 2,3-dioxygenase [Sphaerisporangium krabiense]|uniref:Tryptophan 2,3-dioxygenase n=1 Tax=Sphaerisporangium krabiense TaxID=763782 RepID=A0A7W8Z4V7_9ACTN|nr:tryptophan 2,3-dioxygenase family protein [Sphaerisporangium krabiense]MBB5627118.1 tryptophan 2,3-dioxygenase [Sphaerisporangium krabiense]GII65276.1 tryptophan 2,3-dioxygenase [Sphaerisporangium krabiense]